MGFTTAVPEIARISLVAAMIGGWLLVLFGILSGLVGDRSDKAANVQIWMQGIAMLGLGTVVVAALLFFGQLIVSAIQLWWG